MDGRQRVTVPFPRRMVQRASTRHSRAIPAELMVNIAWSILLRLVSETLSQVAALRSLAIRLVCGRRTAQVGANESTSLRLLYDNVSSLSTAFLNRFLSSQISMSPS